MFLLIIVTRAGQIRTFKNTFVNRYKINETYGGAAHPTGVQSNILESPRILGVNTPPLNPEGKYPSLEF